MKKYLYIALVMLPIFQVDAKIEILDRVAVIVEDGGCVTTEVAHALEATNTTLAN